MNEDERRMPTGEARDRVSSLDDVPVIETVAEYARRRRGALILAAVLYGAVVWPTARGLVELWLGDPDFSHGLLVPLVSVILLVHRRIDVASCLVQRSLWGLAFMVAAALLYLAGRGTATHSMERFGMVALLLGAVAYILGTRFLRAQLFPLAFLFLALPPPLYQLSSFRLELQEFVTQTTVRILDALGEPVTSYGNVIVLAGEQFGVTDACSGVRSLMAIVTTAVLLSFVLRAGWGRGLLLVLIAIPITVAANVLRLLAITLGASWFGVDLARGTPHDLVGMASFAVSLALLYLSHIFFEWYFGARSPAGEATAAHHAGPA